MFARNSESTRHTEFAGLPYGKDQLKAADWPAASADTFQRYRPMTTVLRLAWCPVLACVTALSPMGARAEQTTFRLDFSQGISPSVGGDHLHVENRGARLVEGAEGKPNVLRVGRKGNERWVVSYIVPSEKRNELQTGHIPCPFPLRTATVGFRFRPVDWEIGQARGVPFLHIRTDDTGYLSISYRMLRGTPQLQVVYGVRDKDRAAAGRIPYRYSFTPITPKVEDHWYDVEVSYGGGGLGLRIDESRKTDILGTSTLPPREGWQCEIGSFDSWTVRDEADGLTDIAEVRIAQMTDSVTGAATKDQRYPMVRVPHSRGEMVIDGVIGESGWNGAALLRGVMEIRGQAFAAHQPRFLVTYDENHLYLAVMSPFHGKRELVTNAAERDGDVWLDDCVEVFLDPTPDTKDFYQFAANSKGVVVDAGYHVIPGERFTRGWDLEGLQVAARLTDDTWVLEMAFPFAAFGAGFPEAGARWLFNLCESRVGLGSFSICEVTRGYAHYERFGELLFGGRCPGVRINDFGPLASGNLAIDLSVAGLPNGSTAQVTVRASQHDETADTFFPVFSRSAEAGAAPRVVVTADRQALRSHGRLDTTVEHTSGVLYEGRLNYRVTTEVKLETMRRIMADSGPTLRVTTVQPPTGPDGGHRVRVRILDATGGIAREVVAKITGKRMSTPLELSQLAPGNYQVLVELIDAEGAAVNADTPRPFTVWPDPPPWDSNTLGVSESVPPPWTPVAVESMEGGVIDVACWNRVYRFGPRSSLPVAVRSGEREILQQPFRVDLVLNGKHCEIRKVSHRVVSRTDRGCCVESQCVGDWGTFVSRSTIEFDGFIWSEFEIRPTPRGEGRRTSVDRVSVLWDMPLAGSTLLNAGFRTLEGTGLTPAEWHRKMDGAFWVGNERGGISCAVESHQYWSNADEHRQAFVRRDAEGTQIGVHMVDTPFETEAPVLRYGIAFLVTPTRPRPNGYRKLRECSWMGTNHMRKPYPINISFWNATPFFMGAPAWATSDDEVRALYAERKRKHVPRVHNFHGLRESGARSTWYSTFSHSARNSPEFIWCGEDWRTGPSDRLYGNTLYGYVLDMVAVCKTEDYSDYWLWRFDKSRREAPVIDGIYYDLMHLQRCTREDHGHGYTDREGKRQATVQIREHRKWLLRVYSYLKARDPQTPVMSHLSGHSAFLMAHSFSDYLWDGELWVREVIRDLSYENLSLDTFRSETLDTIYGPHIRWISQLGRALTFLTPKERKKKSLKPYAQRHCYAMLLVHDLVPAGNDRFQQDTITLWETLDRFDLDDADRLLPYWEKGTGVGVMPVDPSIVVTAYVKPDRALLVVFNNTDSAQDITVTLDPQRVFGGVSAGGIVWKDAEKPDGSRLGEGAELALPIALRDFRLLWVDVAE
mgnify:FL=1|jgi:hypothetical protein